MTATAEDIEKYLAIPSAGGGDYHPFLPEIAYISSASGGYQIYTKNLESGDVTRISDGDDRSTNPVYLPNGDLLYITDAGGDEKYQFMIHSGGESWRLTGSRAVKHNFSFVSDRAIYFSANIDDPERLDVYRYVLPVSKNQPPELMMRAQRGFPLRPVLVNDDETRLVISRVGGNLKNDLLLYDVTRRETFPLTESVFPGHNSRFEPVEFVSDRQFLLTSDLGREHMSLALFDLDTGSLTWLEEDRFDTGHAELSSEDLVLFTKNVDGADEFYMATLRGAQLHDVAQLPLPEKDGILVSGDFRSFIRPFVVNKAGDRVLFSFSSPTMVPHLMEVHLTSRALQPVVNPPEFDGPPFAPATLHAFRSFDGLSVPYYIYQPDGEGPFPAVFIIHGGPEAQSRPAFNNQVQLMVSRGYMVLVPNIRGSRGYGRSYLSLDDIEKRLDSIRDIASLAEHLKQSSEIIDGQRLIIYGGSYGGFAVLSSITEFPELFAAAVDIVGISNFVTFLKNTASWRRRLRETEYGSLERDQAFLESVSPIHKVDRIKTPLLIVQGRNDERVPLSESEQMHAALVRRNVPCDLIVFDDEGHGVVKKTNQVVQFEATFRFLEKHLPATA